MHLWSIRGVKAQCQKYKNCERIAEVSEINRCKDGQRKARGDGGMGRGHSGVRGVLHQLFLDGSSRPSLGVLSLLRVPTSFEKRRHGL